MFVLLRFGVLSLAAHHFFLFFLNTCPLTLDFSTWYAPRSTVALLALAALAAYSYFTATQGRPLFRTSLLED